MHERQKHSDKSLLRSAHVVVLTPYGEMLQEYLSIRN